MTEPNVRLGEEALPMDGERLVQHVLSFEPDSAEREAWMNFLAGVTDINALSVAHDADGLPVGDSATLIEVTENTDQPRYFVHGGDIFGAFTPADLLERAAALPDPSSQRNSLLYAVHCFNTVGQAPKRVPMSLNDDASPREIEIHRVSRSSNTVPARAKWVRRFIRRVIE